MQSKYRLKSNRSFDVIYKRGKRVYGDAITLSYLPSKYSDTLKVGFSVGKKVGKAVIRNKIKRRLKEGFRSLIPYIKKGYSYVVSAKAVCCELSYFQLLDQLSALVKKADLWVE